MVTSAVVIGGVGLWWVVRAVFARLSGWNRLALRYPAPGPPPFWQWRGQTVKVGAIRYRRCVQLAAMPDALYLAERGLLRHPLLRIPWSELQQATEGSFYGHPAVRVSIGAPPVGALEFRHELYRSIAATPRGDAPR